MKQQQKVQIMGILTGNNVGDWSEINAIAFKVNTRCGELHTYQLCYFYKNNGNYRGDFGGRGRKILLGRDTKTGRL